jgi:hypothetical protein
MNIHLADDKNRNKNFFGLGRFERIILIKCSKGKWFFFQSCLRIFFRILCSLP